ncbi:hypothetical protein [Solimonas marina]|uniref:Uncharacterized protein n=1 Tax=Solimonas marina TaxID=2714601 RepID=A0A970B5Z8_9GAMM|nr:hypothetical protein [Solimonas marina]NKF22115.1 hypothetical protein [Solimonas marina]
MSTTGLIMTSSSSAAPGQQYSIRKMMWGLIVAITIFVFFPFSMLIASDCYFSRSVFYVLTSVFFICFIASAWFCFKKFWRDELILSSRKGPRRVGPVEQTVIVLLFSGGLSAYAWLAVYSTSLLALFVTARQPTHFTAEITAVGGPKGGKGCGADEYSFYNRPIARRSYFCGYNKLYPGARSGDQVSIVEDVGVLGVRFIGVKRDHSTMTGRSAVSEKPSRRSGGSLR